MDGMSELLETKPMSDRMLLHMAALIRAEELKAEYAEWRNGRLAQDAKDVDSILTAWMFRQEQN